MKDSARQKQHYTKIHRIYEEHYYDRWSMRYRDKFIYPLIWQGLDLNGLTVAELACGSGHNSQALLARFPQARFVGFDISPSACSAYRDKLGFPALEVDLTKPIEVEERFDMAFVVGGLHHCVVDLDQTLKNVAKILKPGGTFVMLEPNARFFLEAVRQVWYRADGSFDSETEHALDHDVLLRQATPFFHPHSLDYFGGPAFFGVLNSMILRIPLWLKPLLSPPLMAAESLWNRMPGRVLHNVFLARWKRTATAPAD